jgi:formate dehydrogenase gamma subunit
MMEEQILTEKNAVVRHSAIEIAEHWIIALSGLVLLFSGFGEFPMYKRFMVTQIRGLGWTGNFWIHLNIHYLAAIVFTGAAVFHILYHGILGHRGLMPRKGDGAASLKTILSFVGIGEEPKADKYLPEQRLAYAFIGIVSLVLIVTGLIKVVKNFPSVYLPPFIISWSTLIHTFATFLFLFGFVSHIAALLLRVNWPLVKPIFTGKVDLDYVRHRHTIWYEELIKAHPPEKECIEDEPVPEEVAPAAGETPAAVVSEAVPAAAPEEAAPPPGPPAEANGSDPGEPDDKQGGGNKP